MLVEATIGMRLHRDIRDLSNHFSMCMYQIAEGSDLGLKANAKVADSCRSLVAIRVATSSLRAL